MAACLLLAWTRAAVNVPRATQCVPRRGTMRRTTRHRRRRMERNDALLADWRQRALSLETEVGRAVIGQQRVMRLVNTAVFARGHVLLQGDVGVGKTTLLRAFAQVLGGAFARIEGTVDLMPDDLIYYTYISERGPPGGRARPADPRRRGPGDLLLQRDQPRPAAGAFAAAARDGRAQRLGLQPRVPLPAPAGVRRPQPRRARGDLRDQFGRARPLHDGGHHRAAGRRGEPPRADVRPALPRHRPPHRRAAGRRWCRTAS